MKAGNGHFLKYPDLINDRVDYYDLKDFLHILSSIFKWDYYEKDTIGNGDSIDYYANILSRWMNGAGLKQILDNSIKYNKNNNKSAQNYTKS